MARDQAELGLAASGLVDPQMFRGRNLLRQGGLSGSGERRLRDGPGDLVVPAGLDYRAPAEPDGFSFGFEGVCLAMAIGQAGLAPAKL
jgi:hypothetical protein